MVWVGMDLKDYLVLTPHHGQECHPLDKVSQSLFQPWTFAGIEHQLQTVGVFPTGLSKCQYSEKVFLKVRVTKIKKNQHRDQERIWLRYFAF